MRAAHRRLAGHYQSVGRPENYVGPFYPGPHTFDLEMQAAAFAWLAERLRADNDTNEGKQGAWM